MRKWIVLLVLGCALCVAPRLMAQQASTSALSILQSSFIAQTGQITVQDASLSGDVESIAGSDDETVSFAYLANLAGSSRSEIDLSVGKLIEVRDATTAGVSGMWMGADGQQHTIAGQNLITGNAWCFPLLAVEGLLANKATVASLAGTGDGLIDLQFYTPAPSGTDSSAAAFVQHLSQMELDLTAGTLLPATLKFTMHSDNNAFVDIPVVVKYSDYQTINGVAVPMHIQRYVNGTLALDVHLQTASFNTGLTQTDFSQQ